MKFEHIGEKMVIFKVFFCKTYKLRILLFLPPAKTKLSHKTFQPCLNAREIETSVEPVSIAKGCRFTNSSRFYSLKVYSKLTIALTVVSIGEERATNTCRLINTYERNQITQNNDFLNCILF